MATIQQYFSIGSCIAARWLTEDSFLFLSNRSGVNQVWKKDLTTGEETQLTNFTERIGGVYPKNGSIFFTMDLGGNENEQIHVFREGEEVVNLTNNNAVRHQFGGIKPDGKTIVFSSNGRTPQTFDICQMNTETGVQEIVIQNSDNYNMPAGLSPNGKYFLYNKLKAQSDNCMWIADIDAKTAKNMLENAISKEIIANCTGLALDEIEKLLTKTE